MRECDVCVIGSGPGGYVAAIRAAQLGAKAVVVERRDLGGVCLNIGCIPSKTWIHCAQLYHKMQHAADFGLKLDLHGYDCQKIVERKNKVVQVNTGGIGQLFKSRGIEVIYGEAEVKKGGEVSVGSDTIRAKSIIVASGGRPANLPGLELDKKLVIGSTEALELTEIPERILVIGAGALGAEFACVWHALGKNVTMVEALDSVLPKSDTEVGKRLGATLKKKGMDVRTGTKVSKLDRKQGKVIAHLEGKKAEQLEVDLVLVAIGLQCNSECVASSGVALGPRGGIVVNDRMETSVPGLYAIGDVIDKTWLAHGASAEGIVAATNATGGDKKMDYRVVPACAFTMPEVAGVGITEQEAEAQGMAVKTGRFMFTANGRAHAIGETDGIVKLIGDARTDELLGVHIMSHEAGEMIHEAAVAMRLEATVHELADTIHTHPTLSEAVLEAAEDYFGMGIHTPAKKKR